MATTDMTRAANVYTATSIDEIRAALGELGRREATVTARLDELVASQKDLSRQLNRLDLARAQLGSHALSARAVSNGMLASASQTARRISTAVDKLDREQAAVKATLEVVEQVAELKSCVLGVHGSMGAPQDWETAASYLHRASQIPDSIIDGAFAEQIVPTSEVPDPPRVTLNAAAESLCGLFLREFEKAAKEGDGARVTRFFKLFPLIGRSNVGLDAYGRYVCSGIAARARSNLNATQRQDNFFYANALTKLFEHIAQIVDGHEPLVERHYGEGSMIKVIERIQVEADVQGGIILDTWTDEKQVNRKLTDVKSYPFNFLVQSFVPAQKSQHPTPRTGSPSQTSGIAGDDDAIDMKEVDSILTECAMMLGRYSLYTRFLAFKGKTTGTDETVIAVPEYILNSNLQRKIKNLLIEPFNIMATFFFRRSVEKAFQLDESPSDLTLNPAKALGSNPPFITSAVDDVMYIANQVLQRTLATSQPLVVSSVVPSVGRVLSADFFGMVQRKMRDESYPKAAIQGALPPESLIISFLVQINNLDVATDYVRRIIGSSLGQAGGESVQQGAPQMSEVIDESFPFEHDSKLVTKALRGVEHGFEAKTSELINEALEVMMKQVMRSRLRPVVIEAFRDADYLASHDADSGDEQNRGDDLVGARFERGWQAFTLPLKRIVTPRVYDKLMSSTIAHLARMLEKRIWSYYGRVSELGAVRLERDIAEIVSAAVETGRYELRDSFARCVQMTLVMNMEEDEWDEISRMSGTQLERESGVQWKLDGDERKRARGLIKDRHV